MNALKDPLRRVYYCPRVDVVNSDLPMLRRFQELMGGTIYNKVAAGEHNRQVWRWAVYGKPAVDVARLLAPLLVGKRQQAELLMEFEHGDLRRLPEGASERRAGMFTELKRLKQPA